MGEAERLSELSGKTVLFIRTSSNSRLAAYLHLHSLGVKIIMVNPVKNYADPAIWKWIFVDTWNVDLLQESIESHLKSWNMSPVDLDGVLTFDEYGVYPCSVLGERWGRQIICPACPEIIKKVNVKSSFRSWCASNNIPAPKSIPLWSTDDLKRVEEAGLKYPVVLKPSPGAGSLLVRTCDSFESLCEAAKATFGVLDTSRDINHWRSIGVAVHLVVEEYIDGDEVDIDCIVKDTHLAFAGISLNFPTKPPFFCEEGGLAPCGLSERSQQKLLQLVESFLDAIRKTSSGKVNCCMHFEAKLSSSGVAYPIEVNLRMGAAETYRLNLSAFGLNLAEQYVRVSCGLPVIVSAEQQPRARTVVPCYIASVNFRPNQGGTIIEQKFPPAVVGDPAYVDHMEYWSVGDTVLVPPKGFYALGWMCARGSSADEAVSNLKRLSAQVDIKIEDSP